MKRRFAIAIAIVVGTFAGVGGAAAVIPRLPQSPTVEGLKIGGEVVPNGVSADTWLRDREETLTERRIELRHGDLKFEPTLAEVGVRIDMPATLNRAQDIGHRGSIFNKLKEAEAAREGKFDLPVVYRLDAEVGRNYLRGIASKFEKSPVDAEIDLLGHRKIPDQAGRELDVQASVEELQQQLASDGPRDLITRELPPKSHSQRPC